MIAIAAGSSLGGVLRGGGDPLEQAAQARRSASQTLVGTLGEASTALVPRGQVKINGEIWEARASQNARAGDTVRVTHVNGLLLEVEPAEAP